MNLHETSRHVEMSIAIRTHSEQSTRIGFLRSAVKMAASNMNAHSSLPWHLGTLATFSVQASRPRTSATRGNKVPYI